MTILNSEPYNKSINTKDNINADAYLVYLKQDNIDLMDSFLNSESDNINSWSSRNRDKKSWLTIVKEIERRSLLGKFD